MKKIILVLLLLFITSSCETGSISNAKFPLKVMSLSSNPFGETTYMVRDNDGKIFYIFTGKEKPHKIGDIIE